MVAEVALSLMLLVGASLMIRTFLAMQDIDLGFRADRLLTMRVPLSEQRHSDAQRRTAFFQELLDRVRVIPGVKAVGLNTSVHPMGNWTFPVEVEGSPLPPVLEVVTAWTGAPVEAYLPKKAVPWNGVVGSGKSQTVKYAGKRVEVSF